MRIALFSPFVAADTGNWVTAERIEEGLLKSSAEVLLIPVDKSAGFFDKELSLLKAFKPDFTHFFNGVKCSKIFDLCHKNLNLPAIVTVTGTDAFSKDESDKKIFSGILALSSAVTVFHQKIKERLVSIYKLPEEKIFVVPQSVSPLFKSIKCETKEDKEPLFFLPAGIRGVKDPIYSLNPFSRLMHNTISPELIFAGPPIDKEYFIKFENELKKYNFAKYIGDVPHIKMPEFYKRCWVVLNTSISEGGMSNTLLEGMFFKKPLLVRGVEGNVTIVKDGFNGFTFSDEDQFVKKAKLLITSKSLREEMGENGYKMLLKEFSSEKEINGYLDVYKKCLPV